MDDDEPCGLVIPSNRESPGVGEWAFWARRDSWIPSPERELRGELTMPGISPDGRSMGLTMKIVSREIKEALKRVTQDIGGLRQLIQGEQYRAAVILTDDLLTDFGQGVGRAGKRSQHTVSSIQLWFTRLTLLIKLGKTDIAETESAVWLDCDRPDLYYQFYPMQYGGRLGTMVPFQMRLLLALLPAHFGRHFETLNRLFSILDTVLKIRKNLDCGLCEDGSHVRMSPSNRAKSKKLWNMRENRILIAIANIAVEIKDFHLSTQMLKQIISSQPCSALQRIVYATLARYSLQFDDNQGGKESLDQAGSTILTLGLLGTGGTDFEYLVGRGYGVMCKLFVRSLNNKAGIHEVPLSYPRRLVPPPPGFAVQDAFIPYSPYNIYPVQHIFPMNPMPRPPPGFGPLPDPMYNMGTMPHPYRSLSYQAFPFMYPPMTLNPSPPTCPPYGHLPPQGCNAPNLPNPPPPQQSEEGAEPSLNNNDA